MSKRILSLLLCVVMLVGLIPYGAVKADAVVLDKRLEYTGGATFDNDRDQLCMTDEFAAVPLSFEATVMLPAGYTDRAGVIAGNYRNGPNGGEFDSTREYVNVEIAANGVPRLYWQESHGTGTAATHKIDAQFSNINVATGEYVHLAITYDPDTDAAKCYVNGELQQTVTNGNITPTIPYGPLMVGGDYRNEASTVAKDCKGNSANHNEQYFKGTIANLSVWSSVLTDTQVQEHFDALCDDGSDVPSSGSDLLGSWDFTAPDANGDYADQSANGNDVYVFVEWIEDMEFAEGDYRMLVFPDPQILMKWQTSSWYKYTKWIKDNAAALNVEAIISVGDMVNDNNTTQWTNSVKGCNDFDDTGIPWMPMRGNHDPSAEFNQYFPYSKYSKASWFGGSYEEGKMDNIYWFVNAGGREYMILYLGWAPSWDVLDWADEVISAFPEKNVIVSTHAYMNWDGELLEKGVSNYSGFSGYPEGTDIWAMLKKHENVVLALGGHIGATDLICWEDDNAAGNAVTSMLVDSQHLDYVAAGLVAVLTFHEDSDTVDVNWYSPVKDAFFRERDQFSINVPHIDANDSAVDKTYLQAAVFNCENLPNINYDESWTAFAAAVATAKSVLNDDAATQTDVDNALKALGEAKAALKEREGLTFSAAAKNYAEFTECAKIPETVEVWVKIPKGYTTRNLIAGGYGYKSATAKTEVFWALEMQEDGTLRWWEEAANTEMKNAKFDGTNSDKKILLNTGEWTLVSIVRDQENKEVRAYINGELAGTTKNILVNGTSGANVFSATKDKTTTDPTRLGRDWREFANQAALTFEGRIGEIRTWNDDRTAAEIKAGFENGVAANAEGLYGMWKLADLPAGAHHPYTFNNLSTSAVALSALAIKTVGFTTPVDTTELQNAVTAAKALSESGYSADSWAALETALTAADAVLAAAAPTWDQVDKALADLEAAVEALEVIHEGLTFSAAAKNYAQFTDCTKIPESVDIWVKIPKGYTGREMIVGGYGVSGKGKTEDFWSVEMNKDTGTLRWWEESDYKEMSGATFSGVKINTGEWLLISIVRDQENKEIRAYINGEYAGTTTAINAKVGGQCVFDYTTGKMTSDPPRLGRDWREQSEGASKTLSFEGQIGEIRMWNDDRTAAEIKASYENDCKVASQRDLSYLSDADLYGAWRLRDLEQGEHHVYTYQNLATGTAAATALGIKTLGFTTPVDTTMLEETVDAAEKLLESDYTAESWAELKTALDGAKAVLDDLNPTWDEVDAAQLALDDAIDGLEVPRDGLTFEAAKKNYAEFSQNMTIPESVDIWFQMPNGYNKRNTVLGGYGYKSATSTTEIFWAVDFYNGELVWWEEASGKELWAPICTGTVNDGEWHMLSIVREQENKQILAYIDGELVKTITNLLPKGADSGNVMDYTTGKTTTDPTRLGRDWRETQTGTTHTGKPLVFEGKIGELRVYNDDRTAVEIKANYENDTLPASQKSDAYLADANLVGAWRPRDLDFTAGEYHPYTFANLSTGSAAVSSLVLKTVGFTNPEVESDKTALKADIDAAKALVETDYTAETWAALKTKLTAAQTVYDNPAATQAMVDTAEDELEAAIAALVLPARAGLQFEVANNEYAQFTAPTVIPETVSLWVKIPANSTKREMIVGCYGYGDTTKIFGWGLEVNASGYLRWWEEATGDVEMSKAAFDGATSDKAIKMNDGQWKYITIVRDQESKEIRAYVNGELAATTKNVYTGGTTGTNVLDANSGKTTYVEPRIGRDWRENMGKDAITFNGEIADIRIWNDDRTDAEIKADYENDLKPASQQDKTYLADDELFGAWKLRELVTGEMHPYTFPNLATGADAEASVGIKTVAFANPDGTVYVDGLTFTASKKQYAQFTDCTVIPESVDIWVKIPAGYTDREMIVGGYGVNGKGYSEIFWSVEMNASKGTLRWWEEGYTVVDGANSPREMAEATFSNIKINTGEWILISIVRDQENQKIYAYIDGELAGTTTSIKSKVGGENVFNYTTGKMTTDPPRLGRDWRETLGGSNEALSFQGQIGEIRIWTDDRTAAEIKACYDNDILPEAQQVDTYLADANLYGAWRLHELQIEDHPYTFKNKATGAAAATNLGIKTVGFVDVAGEGDVAPDYTAQYNATGISFTDSTHQMRAEEQFDKPVRTISALVNLPSGSAGGAVFSNYMSKVGGYSHTRSWLGLEVNSSGQPKLTMRVANDTATTYTADTVDLRGKGWVLLTCVFDDECDVVRWFINGKRVETIGSATAQNPVRYGAMKIGGDYTFSLVSNSANYSNYNTNYFKGEIAYVSAWSEARAGVDILAEAQALQTNSTNVPTTGDGLMGSWSFAGNGDVLKTEYADKSGNGNDAVPYSRFINDMDADYLKDNGISTEFAEGDYSILLMPDIQNITRDHMGGYAAFLDDYMQWIADNKDKYNIIGYVSVGDLVQDDAKNNSSGEWNNVANAFPILEQAGIPGVPVRGNHDGSGFFSQFIDYDFYAAQDWFGGSFEEGYLDNCYWYMEGGDRDYLVLSLGWSTAGDAIATGNANGRGEREIGSNPELLAWVNEVIEDHPNHSVILTAHNGMNWDTTYTANGKKLYDEILSKHDNVAFAAYGHIDERIIVNRHDKRGDGVEFPSLLVDGQGIDQYEGCHAFIGLLTFTNNSNDAFVNWYSVREESLYRVDGQYSISIPHEDKNFTYTAAGFTGSYDGQPHGITITIGGEQPAATIKYGTTEGTYDLTTAPTYTDGTHTVYFQITADGYNTATGSVEVKITAGVLGGYSVTPTTGAVYTGEAQPSATVVLPEGATATYTTGGQSSNTVPAFTDAGTYTVSYTISKAGYDDVTGSYTFTIANAPASALNVVAKGVEKVYDGAASAVSVTAIDGAKVEYSTDNQTWSTTAPSFTDVVDTTVYYRVSKANYDTATGSVKVKITEAEIAGFEVKAADTAKYDGTEKTSATVTAGKPADAKITFTCGSDTFNEVPKFTNVGTYEVSYTIEKANYKSVTGTYTFKIEKGDITGFSVTANAAATYDGSEKTSATVTVGTPADAKITYKVGNDTFNAVPKFTEVGTYEVSYTISKDGYNDVTGSYTFTINNAAASALNVVAKGVEKVYDGAASAVSVTAIDGAKVEYSTDNQTWSTTAPAFTDVVDTTVYYRVSKAGYDTATGSVKVKITEAEITGFEVKAADTAKFDGTEKTSATVTVGTPADAKITYKVGNDTFNAVPKFTEVGTYEVSYTIEKANYKSVTGSYTFTIEKGDITGFEVKAADTAKYDGTEKASATVTVGTPADAKITYKVGNDTFTAVPKFTEVGTYEVSYTISKAGYNDVTGSYEFTIEKGELELDYELYDEGEVNTPAAKIENLPDGVDFRFGVFKDKASWEDFRTTGEGDDDDLVMTFGENEIPVFNEPGTYYLVVLFEDASGNFEDLYDTSAFEVTAPAPETGDTFALGLWLTVAALTAAAGAILVLRRREEA